ATHRGRGRATGRAPGRRAAASAPRKGEVERAAAAPPGRGPRRRSAGRPARHLRQPARGGPPRGEQRIETGGACGFSWSAIRIVRTTHEGGAMPGNLDLILTLAGCLAAALALGYLTQRLGLSPLVGYLLAGVVVGPHTPGFVADQHLAEQL